MFFGLLKEKRVKRFKAQGRVVFLRTAGKNGWIERQFVRDKLKIIPLTGLLIITLAVSSIQTRSLQTTYYPETCFGSWQSPEFATGPTTVSSGADAGEFTVGNSAFFTGGSQQIFCKGFRPEAGSETLVVKTVDVRFSLAVATIGAADPLAEVPALTTVEESFASSVPDLILVEEASSVPEVASSSEASTEEASSTEPASTLPTEEAVSSSSEPVAPAEEPAPVVELPTPAPVEEAPVPAPTEPAPEATPPAPVSWLFNVAYAQTEGESVSSTPATEEASSSVPMSVVEEPSASTTDDQASTTPAEPAVTVFEEPSSTPAVETPVVEPAIASTSDELASTTPESVASSTPEEVVASTSDELASTTPEEATSSAVFISEADILATLAYSFDGGTWYDLGPVTRDNWNALTYTIPVSDSEETYTGKEARSWEDLAKLQFRVSADVFTVDNSVAIYLDGVELGIGYALPAPVEPEVSELSEIGEVEQSLDPEALALLKNQLREQAGSREVTLSHQAKENDWVVFKMDNGGEQQDIFLKNASTGEYAAITATPGNETEPVVSGDLIAWAYATGFEGHERGEIFVYRISTGETKKVTDDEFVDQLPRFVGKKLVWEKTDADGIVHGFRYDEKTGTAVQDSKEVFALVPTPGPVDTAVPTPEEDEPDEQL